MKAVGINLVERGGDLAKWVRRRFASKSCAWSPGSHSAFAACARESSERAAPNRQPLSRKPVRSEAKWKAIRDPAQELAAKRRRISPFAGISGGEVATARPAPAPRSASFAPLARRSGRCRYGRRRASRGSCRARPRPSTARSSRRASRSRRRGSRPRGRDRRRRRREPDREAAAGVVRQLADLGVGPRLRRRDRCLAACPPRPGQGRGSPGRPRSPRRRGRHRPAPRTLA